MRIDVFLKERGDYSSRTRAQEAVRAGRVAVNGRPVPPSYEVKEGDTVEAVPAEYASRGGEKLARAFEAFGLSVEGLACADLGASNGGFTEVLLSRGAKRVYAVDVGESQLDARLAQDPRVAVMDRTNARYLTAESFPEPVGFLTADLSFISLTLVLPAIASVLAPEARAVLLVKPQFEAGRGEVGKNGIVKGAAARLAAVWGVCERAALLGLTPYALTNAPVRAGKNIEYLMALGRGQAPLSREYIAAVTAKREDCV